MGRGWIEEMRKSNIKLVGLLLLAVLCQHGGSTLKCGWPGKPVGGFLMADNLPMPVLENAPIGRASVQTNRLLSYSFQFEEGQQVAYACNTERLDTMKFQSSIGRPNRTCQSDGRWSGTRPWCDVNIAYGKSVTYAALNGQMMSDTLMTDGKADTGNADDPAECSSLTRTNAYLSVDLGENYPVRIVGIYGEIGTGMTNTVSKKVQLDTHTCQEKLANHSAFGFECNREASQYNPTNTQGRALRFEHASSFTVSICEVVAYSNPTLEDCGEPEIPLNGEVTITTGSSYQQAKYNCLFGYDLQGSETRLCYGRYWDGIQPICVENYASTTTQSYNASSTDGMWGPEGPFQPAGMEPFQIVLIVICIALAIGLIVALIVLLKYGRLTCCARNGSAHSKKLIKKLPPDDYHRVDTADGNRQQEEAKKRADAMAAADEARRVEEAAFTNRQPFQPNNERTRQHQQLQTQQEPSSTTVYAELVHEPSRRAPPPPSSPPEAHLSPIYAQVQSKSNNADADDSNVGGNPYRETTTPTPPMRKSYVPPAYRQESPEVQMKQQALNAQLKDAIRISRNTDF